MPGVRERIEAILRGRFEPARLEIHDDSARHSGHAGATSRERRSFIVTVW